MVDDYQNLVDTYGPEYTFSQFKRGETIRYRVPGFDGIYRGEVVWVQAPGEVAGRMMPLRYVVACEQRGFVDVVFTTDIVRDEPQ